MKAAIWTLAAALGVVVGCADSGERDGSTGPPSSSSETSPSVQAAAFADVVNSLCEQRYAAFYAMRVDVLNGINFLGVSDETTAFAVNALGVVRDQIPYLRAAPSAPQGWDALVDDYEQRADASNVAAGDGDAVAARPNGAAAVSPDTRSGDGGCRGRWRRVAGR